MSRERQTGSLALGPKVFWRRLTSTPSVPITIFAATLLTSLLLTAAPRVLERVSQDDLRESVAEAEPEQRNITAHVQGFFEPGPGDDPFRDVQREGEKILADGFPPSVQSLISDTHYLVETPRFQVVSFPDAVSGPFPTFINLRHQEDISAEMTLVEGSMPQLRQPVEMLIGPGCETEGPPPDDFVEDPDVLCNVEGVPILEVGVTAETAEAMTVSIGDQMILLPDSTDRRWFGTPFFAISQRLILTVSGIVELSDPSREYWFADTSLHRPRIEENPDFRLIYATGLFVPDQYRALHNAIPFVEQDYTWRFLVDPARIDQGSVAQLDTDLARISVPASVRITTFLPDLISEFVDQRSLTIGLMSTAMTGLLVVAVATVLTLALLTATRESWGTILMRNRGASRGQLSLAALAQGLVLVVPATVLGYLTTLALMPETDDLTPARAAAVLAAGGAAAVTAGPFSYIYRSLGSLQRRDSEAAGSAARRLVFEGFVVVSAVAAVLLLRRRGLADDIGAPASEFDLLLALAPAVIGLAAGLVTLRVMVPVARFLSWMAARGRSLVSYVGLRRLVSMPASARMPVVVILLAVGVAVFSAVVRDSVERGITDHTVQMVGGEFKVEMLAQGTPLPETVDLESLAGDGEWAFGAEFPATTVIGLTNVPRVPLLAIDTAAYREVLARSGVDGSLLDPITDGSGERLPALVSSQWQGTRPPVGSEFTLDVGDVDPRVEVARAIDRFPSLPYPGPFVVVSLQAMRAIEGMGPVPATVAFFDSPSQKSEELRAALAEMHPAARLLSRDEIHTRVAGDPFAVWVGRGLTAIVYLATAFAVVAALAGLALTAARRRRDLGYLRTVGLQTGEATAVTALEQLPPVVLAAGVGGLLGAAVARSLSPALDIGSFTGGVLPGVITLDIGVIALVGAVLMGVLAVAVVIFVATGRGQDEGSLLRVGDE